MTKAGKPKKRVHAARRSTRSLYAEIEKQVRAELTDAMNTQKYAKLESYSRVDAGQEEGMKAARKSSRPKPRSCSTV